MGRDGKRWEEMERDGEISKQKETPRKSLGKRWEEAARDRKR